MSAEQNLTDAAVGFTRTYYRWIVWHFYWAREDSQFWPRLVFSRRMSKARKSGGSVHVVKEIEPNSESDGFSYADYLKWMHTNKDKH